MQISAFGHALLYLVGGGVFTLVLALVSSLLAPNRPNPEKNSTYECGEEALGSGFVQFNPRYYVVALVFLIFEVEILFLFPWIRVFANVSILKSCGKWGAFALVEMLIFMLILILGWVYAWVKGDLDWVKPQPIAPERINPVPDQLYAELNERLGC